MNQGLPSPPAQTFFSPRHQLERRRPVRERSEAILAADRKNRVLKVSESIRRGTFAVLKGQHHRRGRRHVIPQLRDALVRGIEPAHVRVAGKAAGKCFSPVNIGEPEIPLPIEPKLRAGRHHMEVVGHVVRKLRVLVTVSQPPFIEIGQHHCEPIQGTVVDAGAESEKIRIPFRK